MFMIFCELASRPAKRNTALFYYLDAYTFNFCFDTKQPNRNPLFMVYIKFYGQRNTHLGRPQQKL